MDGAFTLNLKLTLHDQAGTTNWIRIQQANGSGQTEKARTNIAMGPCHDCTQTISIPLNFSTWTTGLQEVRISLNVPDEQPDGLAGSDSGAQRMFNSTGWQVCVRACTPAYRSGPNFLEARGWYEGHEYQNARLESALSSVRSCGSIDVRMAQGSNAVFPTTFSGAFIDPNFHAGDDGIPFWTRNGPTDQVITMPCLASGAHKLVLIAGDKQEAGVLAIPFTVP
jgi:hypothetical protein